MKTTFVATVLNEEENISKLLNSLFSQSKKPNEIIIVDGGSKDRTLAIIKKYKGIRLVKKNGNRALGRNEGIKKSTGDTILLSDSGCVLDKKWIEKITEPFKNSKVEVVSGYYDSTAHTPFEKCLIPYVLVMPDRIDRKNFLPAARSMAFKKQVWKKVGGFPQRYSSNEDYIFAKRLKKENIKMTFKEDAKVYWIPRKNFLEAFIMFFRFAMGDAESGILRPKVVLIFARYILGAFLLLKSLVFSLLIALYFIWAITKNYKYVKKWQAFIYLPLLQVASDLAVITGTIWGTLKKQ